MKKLLSTFAVAAVFGASMAMAQPGGTPPTPADQAARRVTMLTDLLTLTAAQQTQATTIFTNAATAAATVRENAKTAHDTLAAAVKANSASGIDQAAATIGSLTAQQTSIDAKAEAAFYQILTADQQTKLASSRGGLGGFGPGGPGGPGGRGPGPNGFGRR